MKVSVARGELLDALSVVAKGLSSRTTLPILSGIHVSAHGEDLILQSTDLEISIKTSTRAKVEKPGQSVLPGRLLNDIVRSLPEAAVSIDVGETGEAKVVCGTSSFSMRTLSADDFPKFPEVSAETTLSVPSDAFAGIVHRVSKAVSRDETRPILTGVLVVMDGSDLRMVATDSYRLCLSEIAVDGLSGQMEVVVPGRALEDVARLATNAEALSVGVSENQVIFSFGATTFVSRRIEGSFPNYRQLIPKEVETKVEVDRGELLDAIKRVSLMAQHNAPIRLSVAGDEHTLSLGAQTQDVGEAHEDLQVAITGQDVEIAFNHAYLLDGVSVAEGEKIAIEIVSPLKPGLLKVAGSEAFVYLLMPVRLG